MAVSHTNHSGVMINVALSANTSSLTPSGSEGAVSAGVHWFASTGQTLTSVKHGSGGTDLNAVTGATATRSAASGNNLQGRGYALAVGSTANGVYVVFSASVYGALEAHVSDSVNQTTPAVSGFGQTGFTAVGTGNTPTTLTLTQSSISCAVGDMVESFGFFQTNASRTVSGVSSTTGTETFDSGVSVYRGASYYDTADSTSETANMTATAPAYYSGFPYYAYFHPNLWGEMVGFVLQQSGGGGPSPINEPIGSRALNLTGFAPVGFRPRIPEPVTAGSLTLTGFSPEYSVFTRYKPEEIGPGSLTLVGFAPEYTLRSPAVNIAIPSASLTLSGVAPEYYRPFIREPITQGSVTLTGIAPEFTVFTRLKPEPVPQGSLTLTGFAPGFNVFSGQIQEPITQGSITLTGYAPEFRIPFIREPITAGTLKITGYAPEFTIPHDVSIEVPNNVIRLSAFAPGFSIPSVGQAAIQTAGGKRPVRRRVIIGNRPYWIENNVQLSALLNDYLIDRREQLAQIEALPEKKQKKRYQVLKTQIAVTEKRIQTLDNGEEEELLLMMIA